jgi:hypothetical protein
MHFDSFSFGSIRIDGIGYEHDIVIDRGEIRKRKKKPSKKFQEQFRHTPLSIERRDSLAGDGYTTQSLLKVSREIRMRATLELDDLVTLLKQKAEETLKGIEAPERIAAIGVIFR